MTAFSLLESEGVLFMRTPDGDVKLACDPSLVRVVNVPDDGMLPEPADSPQAVNFATVKKTETMSACEEWPLLAKRKGYEPLAGDQPTTPVFSLFERGGDLYARTAAGDIKISMPADEMRIENDSVTLPWAEMSAELDRHWHDMGSRTNATMHSIDWANLKKAPKADGFDGWVKPVTAAGRVEAVLDLAQQGHITSEQARQLLVAPAIEPPKATNPLDVKYDGWTLRNLLEVDAGYQSDHHPHVTSRRDAFTPAQLGAISAHWSAELRAKVAASKAADKERDQRQVLVDLEDE